MQHDDFMPPFAWRQETAHERAYIDLALDMIQAYALDRGFYSQVNLDNLCVVTGGPKDAYWVKWKSDADLWYWRDIFEAARLAIREPHFKDTPGLTLQSAEPDGKTDCPALSRDVRDFKRWLKAPARHLAVRLAAERNSRLDIGDVHTPILAGKRDS